jgi:hypothetical protein
MIFASALKMRAFCSGVSKHNMNRRAWQTKHLVGLRVQGAIWHFLALSEPSVRPRVHEQFSFFFELARFVVRFSFLHQDIEFMLQLKCASLFLVKITKGCLRIPGIFNCKKCQTEGRDIVRQAFYQSNNSSQNFRHQHAPRCSGLRNLCEGKRLHNLHT